MPYLIRRDVAALRRPLRFGDPDQLAATRRLPEHIKWARDVLRDRGWTVLQTDDGWSLRHIIRDVEKDRLTGLELVEVALAEIPPPPSVGREA